MKKEIIEIKEQKSRDYIELNNDIFTTINAYKTTKEEDCKELLKKLQNIIK